MKRTRICNALLKLAGLCSLVGCDEDEYRRLAEEARTAADRQAQQNTEMAQLNREVAEGAKRLVEADAEARKELVVVHKEIQAERATLNDGFDDLETERQQMARQRSTESKLVPVLEAMGIVTVAIVVVGFCLLLVHGSRSKDASDAELNELLICDLVSDSPQLICGPTAPALNSNPIINNSEPDLLSTAGPEEAAEQGDTN